MWAHGLLDFFLRAEILENIIYVVKIDIRKILHKHNIFVYLKHLEKAIT
jgi:hypothetical protein